MGGGGCGGNENVFKVIVMMVAQVCQYTKRQLIVHFIWINGEYVKVVKTLKIKLIIKIKMSKDEEKVRHTNTNQKKAGVATLTSNKVTSEPEKLSEIKRNIT